MGVSTGRRDVYFRRFTAPRRATGTHVWRRCWGTCGSGNEKDRVMAVGWREEAGTAIEAPWS
jgi:hypothetical protein